MESGRERAFSRNCSQAAGAAAAAVAFWISRLTEFCSGRELTAQTGHPPDEWPLVIVKELVDNALDECEEAQIAPDIAVEVSTERGEIAVADNGRGLPADTIGGVLDYTVRVSSREAYCSPSRGQQGNGLKCILAMAFAIDGTRGTTVIQSHGQTTRILFEMDPVRREPRVSREIDISPVKTGTKITVHWPETACHLLRATEHRFLQVIADFAAFNPHLTLRWRWNGIHGVEHARIAEWRKWHTSDPTSAHWYDRERFARYIAAHVARDQDIGHAGRTVREFVSEIDGLSGTAKQKLVLEAAAASRTSLASFFDRGQEAVSVLLRACQVQTRPVKPEALGIIGADHLRRYCLSSGAAEQSFEYRKHLGTTAGVPYVVEAAFAYRPSEDAGRLITAGVNFSTVIGSPFERLTPFQSLRGVLAAQHAGVDDPVVIVLHYTCPRVDFADRGKGTLALPGDVGRAIIKMIEAVTKQWDKQRRAEIRSDAATVRRLDNLLKEYSRQGRPEPAQPSGILAHKITVAAFKAGMSIDELIVLSDANDPYTSWKRRRDADVFAELFNRLVAPGQKRHLRGLFYRCVMLPESALWPTGQPLINTHGNWLKFQKAAAAARWLGLVPFDRIVDARNDEAKVYVPEFTDIATDVSGGSRVGLPASLDEALPSVSLEGFTGRQSHRLIFYGEKTSLDEVVGPLAKEVGGDMTLTTGESSSTRLDEAIARAAADGRPAVLFYFADFDPSGHQMSTSVARKVQALIDLHYPNLDIKLYRVALTVSQARAWDLPDKPMPPKERRAERWRERFGREQTEIDAAIELAPDQLRAAIFEAIAPFWDDTLCDRVEAAASTWQQNADRLLRAHPDYAACCQRIEDAFDQVQDATDELHDQQDAAAEILKDILPAPPDCPTPAPSGTARPALFDSATDFVTASLRLIADKKLAADDAAIKDDDEEDDEQ
jgi:hypothetical protein